MTLTFIRRRAMCMTHTQAKNYGQKSCRSKVRLETNGLASDGHDRFYWNHC